MTALRRFVDHGDAGKPYKLDREHDAALLGTSLFRKGRLRSALFEAGPILKSGHNNRKIGSIIQKGRWAGFPIFTLTLEERATCPRSCRHWLDCYGNKMNWPVRWMVDAEFYAALPIELVALQAKYNNYVIRLHVLGDFPSTTYVEQWGRWLDQFPGLNAYGYTAWAPESDIGIAISKLPWERFAIRFSNAEGTMRTTETIYEANASGEVSGGVVCPAQTGKAECCATCALCWQTERKIVFLAH